ncbi:MAG: CDP-glycerol glycerophosphotransferase family protein [Oscillospiraceae bacterium]|nr:CDP-glycerol glycerophosphotransferase family protein [Oscillospiraceae bacterium]
MKYFFRDFFAKAYMCFCALIPLDNKSIVFKSDRGLQCTDSPYALFREVRENYPDYKCIWVLKDLTKVPEGAVAVKEGSLQEIKALATSKYWIDNKRKGCWTTKRAEQIYIQTWHGAIFLKKIEKEIEQNLPEYYIKSAKHDSAIADYMLSSCEWATEYIRKYFWYNGVVLKYGIPRSDILYSKPERIIETIRNHYGLLPEERFVLYAPTFRDNGRTDVFKLDFDTIRNCLKLRFGGEWKVVVRLHPNLSGLNSPIIYDQNVLNGNQMQDIYAQIISCDFLITDYSSVMFDGMEADIPVLLYAPDIEEYRNNRGFTFSFEELPFRIATTDNELKEEILQFNRDSYNSQINLFKNTLGFYPSGHASKSIVKLVFTEK